MHIAPGIYWVAIPEAELYILCGCPADSVKHLKKRGLILTKEEKDCIFETGPNAVLLSDVLIQGGNFANLAEFPVLQMLYKQGMIIPNHPGNKCVKPLLIGSQEQVKAQLNYIYRGNYGLTSANEMIKTGVSSKTAKEMMRLKLKFAFGKIHKTQDLLDSLIVEDKPVEIRKNVFITRQSVNIFKIKYQKESVEVNLNLKPHETFTIPYKLDYHNIYREYFAVIHSGEGDGWDYNRPCMGSILVYQGKIYLIDAGPNILESLMALGIGANEIEGIFVTHAHDDHFAGLTCLMRSDHRLKFYTTSLIRYSVVKKLSALVGMAENEFKNYFETCDLLFDEWNILEGLEVKPIFSPHPVETACFFFRTFWSGGYKTYAHLADIVSLKVLKGMITKDSSKAGITKKYFEEVKKKYLMPVHLKKVDIGGGPIHGCAEDFKNDQSEKIILSHTSLKLTGKEKEIGSGAPFGMVDVMIPSYQNYAISNALKFLHEYFPDVPIHQISVLLNNSTKTFNPETILLKKGVRNPYIYLILTGNVEAIRSDLDIQRTLSAGAFIGEISGLYKTPTEESFRAMNFVNTLEIPSNLYHDFIKINGLYDEMQDLQKHRKFLQKTWLFGDMITYQLQNKIVKSIIRNSYKKGTIFSKKVYSSIVMLTKGRVEIISNGHKKRILSPGDFWGEEGILYKKPNTNNIKALTDIDVHSFSGDILCDIPIVRWKLFETLKSVV